MEGLSIFGIPWLIACVLALAVLLVGLAVYRWKRRRKLTVETRRMGPRRLSPDEELKTLGIVRVRKLDEEPATRVPESSAEDLEEDLVLRPFGSDGTRPSRGTAAIVFDLVAEDRMAEPEGIPVPRFSPRRTGVPVDSVESVAMGRHPGTYLDQGSPLWQPSDLEANPDAVAFLLESLWAAMHAQSVALLRLESQSSSYAVDALVSERVTRQIDLFPAGGNMLNLVADDTSISILEPDAFAALRYHANPVISVGHAVAIAVRGPKDRVLLVADVEPGGLPFDKQGLERFGDYADFLARLLPKSREAGTPRNSIELPATTLRAAPVTRERISLEDAIVGTIPDPQMDDINVQPALEEPMTALQTGHSGPTKEREFVFDVEAAAQDDLPTFKVPTFHQAPKRNGSHQSRSEIIAEEMAAARATEEPLALALVVPYDAVELGAREGHVVANAEEQLLERLRGVAGSSRVELFGELVVGVFCNAGPAFVEAWVERVEESGPAVQIGIALLRARHRTPEAFRADAETALREAYERKEDCVIVQ